MFLYQPPEAPKVKKRTAGSSNQSRIEQVFDELWSNSLPVNPAALKRVQFQIKEPKLNYAAIIKELIEDPGLGLHYLKKLSSYSENTTIPPDPLNEIKKLTKQQLSDIFDKPASSISKFDLSKATPAQLLRLQHTYISTKATANLSRQLSASAGQGFVLSLLSQATFNLLAWNYPSQFQRALLYKRRYRTDISETINSLVGIEAKALNSKLIKTLGLPIRHIEELQTAQNIKNLKLGDKPETISLVQAGDLLARANDIEHYPEALSEWHKVEEEIAELGLESPRIEIEQEIHNFMQDLGVEGGLPYKAALFNKTQQVPESDNLTTSNPYITKLPVRLRDDFNSLYKFIKKNSFNQTALKILADQISSKLNLYSGYLYLLKADNQTLSVSLNFGTYKKKRPDLQITSSNPVSQSLFSAHPITIDTGDGLILVCCSLQDSRKQAVLALEWEANKFTDISDFSATLIQAMAHSLVDIIGQRNLK